MNRPRSKSTSAILSVGLGLALTLGSRPASAQTWNDLMAVSSKVVTEALKTSMTIQDFITAQAALVSVSDLKSVSCDIGNFALGRLLPAGPPPPFDACGQKASGGGYYLFGDVGPGGIKPLNRFTAYLPTTSMGCGVRQYNFEFSITGPNTFTKTVNTAADLFDKNNVAALFPGNSAATAAVDAWKSLYREVGDFAVLAVMNPNMKRSYIYVLASNTSKLTALIEAEKAAANSSGTYGNVVKYSTAILTAAQKGSTEGMIHMPDVMTGQTIKDTFAGKCWSPLLFWYMAGTGNVLLK